MTTAELAAALEAVPGFQAHTAPYRAKQIFSWINRGAVSFDCMTNLPRDLRLLLEQNAVIRGSRVREKYTDPDGTVKLALELADGLAVETVLLSAAAGSADNAAVEAPHTEAAHSQAPSTQAPPTQAPSAEAEYTEMPHTGAAHSQAPSTQAPHTGGRRFSACLSTQAGCPIGCVFCKTGSMGFFRNLEPSEIVEQFLWLTDELAQQPDAARQQRRISHLVIMGMGEPLLNLPALRTAIAVLCEGFGLSKRKITISTSGIPQGIVDLAEHGPHTELAFSLISARQELRSRLIPAAAAHPLGGIKEALALYCKKTGRRITLEIVLLGGINTAGEDARLLLDFAANLDAAVNIIPWNPVQHLYFEGKPLRQPAQKEVAQFTKLLEKGGLTVTQRYRRGRGICGACGQLGTNEKRPF